MKIYELHFCTMTPYEALTSVGAFLFCKGLERNSDISLTGHCLLRKLTVKGLPCGKFEVVASYNTDHVVFPRLNAQYRIRGMHESLVPLRARQVA